MKKFLLFLVLSFLLGVSPAMAANVTIGELTNDATPTSDDLIETEDVGGGPAAKKVTLGTLFAQMILNSNTLAGYLSDETGSSGGFVRATGPTIAGLTGTGIYDLSATKLELANGTAPASADCDEDAEKGRIFIDTDATSGQWLYICEGSGPGWILQGDGDTGAITDLDDIGDPVGDGTIAQAGHKLTLSSTLNSAGAIWTFTNTTADLTADVAYIDFKYTDDGDANGYYLRGYDNAGADLKWSIANNGAFTGLSFTATGAGASSAANLVISDVLEIPNDAAPTVDAAGEIAVDTTTDQLQYFGAAKRAIAYEQSKCAVIEDLAAADDNFPLGSTTYARTITKIGCRCNGTCSTGAQISLEDTGGNAMTHTTPTCATTGDITFQAVTAAGALNAGEGLRLDVDNAVSPETDTYEVCWAESVTPD